MRKCVSLLFSKMKDWIHKTRSFKFCFFFFPTKTPIENNHTFRIHREEALSNENDIHICKQGGFIAAP